MTDEKKTQDDHRREHAAMNHMVAHMVVRMARLLGDQHGGSTWHEDADALEAQIRKVCAPVGGSPALGSPAQLAADQARITKAVTIPVKRAPSSATITDHGFVPHARDATMCGVCGQRGDIHAPWEGGTAPDVMQLAAAQKRERNQDRRLPDEGDDDD